MADAKKPSRPRAKPPTKAQALKALGLTQEDLDVLKSLKEGVEAARQFEGKNAEISAIEAESVASKEKLAATAEVTSASPAPFGTGVRDSIGFHPDLSMGPVTETVWYARNARNVEVSYRLTRQKKMGERRTDLKPRGMRGDIVKLQPGDLEDAELQTQVAYGLIEIIPEGEALEAIKKQGYNATQQPHAPLNVLRNELGHPYSEDAIRVASHEEAHGYTVAKLDSNGSESGDLPSRGKAGIDWEKARNLNIAPPGNPAIVSDGFAPQGPNAADMAKDALARQKNLEGPGAGLGTVAVVIEPTQRT